MINKYFFKPILFLFIVLFISLTAKGSLLCVQKDTIAICKVMKITRVKNGYIFDLRDEINRHWYTVASSRKKGKLKNCKKMKVGKSYDFILHPYYWDRIEVPKLGLTFSIYLNGKNIVVPSNSWTSNVYISPNINGKYYCKSFDYWPFINIPERLTMPVTPTR